MLPTLYFAHVRSLDPCFRSQFFLSNTLRQAGDTNGRSECQRWLGVESGSSWGRPRRTVRFSILGSVEQSKQFNHVKFNSN